MDEPKAKLDAVASFVLHYLGDAFQQMRSAAPANVTEELISPAGYTPLSPAELSARQTAIFNNKLLHLAFQLPTVLYNAGITSQLLSADKIHITRHQQYLGIQVAGYGLMIIDLQGKKFHARLWQTSNKQQPVNEKPIDIKEIRVNGATHKRNLNTDFDYTTAIHRDKDYIVDQFKDFLNKEGIPVSLEELASDGIKVNWQKHKELVKKLGPVHEVYKGLIKSSTASTIYDIATASQGKGNLPGVDAIPGGKQLVDIMANDMFNKDALLFIDMAQKTPASKTDAYGNSQGGYQRLINAMRTYNNNDWGDTFQGVYLHEEELKIMEKMQFIIPGAMSFSPNFSARPFDKDGKPYDFFMYIHGSQLNSEYIKMDELGVIYINPATQ
ncbi:hypothetical protein F0L74_14715 [Chitinophaga agrisoli]|uniref:Uncharacterized protein n=1 Tax=Chitinophaga agrisoli TaxID=2607653 RepID=A0A5B2VYK6_9BACT|nr:hypothetical protein [Chitinophaga agrisoli]KAA2243728.1 hypothetical protein F0L74_14715 [Chitinophaga agrisoli]